MLYTSYISNMKNLPEGKYVLVTRWAPKSLDLSKFDDASWEPILAPSDTLLDSYKNGTAPSSALLAEVNSSEGNKIIVPFEKSITA